MLLVRYYIICKYNRLIHYGLKKYHTSENLHSLGSDW